MARRTQAWLMLQYHKEGIIIGGITGAIAAYYLIQQGADLNSITTAGKGLLDYALWTRAAPIEIATYKFYGVLTFIGAALGFTFDYIITRFAR